MKNNLRKKLNPVDSGIGFLVGLLTLIVTTYIVEIFVMLVYLKESLTNTNALKEAMSDPIAFTLMSLVPQACLFIFGLIFTKARKIDFVEAYQYNKSPGLIVLAVIPVLALFLILSDFPMLTAVDDIFRRINYKPMETNLDALIRAPGGFILALFLVCALPAICEELIFRGIVLQGLASRYKPFTAILLSALAFSLTHMSPAQTAHQFVLGVALGYIVLATKSIWSGILLHFCNNLWALIIELAPSNYFVFPGLDNIIFIYAGGAFITVLGLIAFFLAVDIANKRVSDGILAQSIRRLIKREKYNGYVINYDIITPPPAGLALMPMTEEEYNNYVITKHKRGKRLFIGLFLTALGVCLLSWIFNLISGMINLG
ncbi:MAG TPA: CPBP family intramembrane glutamic endopeptidase [Clostridia bacterium]